MAPDHISEIALVEVSRMQRNAMMVIMMTKPCPCGSGHPRRELVDAAGIFCAFVCDACEGAKRAGFNPRIFDGGSRYAATGAEEDIFADDQFEPEV